MYVCMYVYVYVYEHIGIFIYNCTRSNFVEGVAHRHRATMPLLVGNYWQVHVVIIGRCRW